MSENSAQPAACAAEATSPTVPSGRPDDVQRRIEGVLDDRLCRAQRVRADPEDHGVARPDHAGGVREHVGPTLEHEADDAERCAARLDGPAVVFDDTIDRVPGGRSGRPPAEAGDHAGTHRVGELESGRRPTPSGSSYDIGVVGRCDRGERGVVGEAVRERVEELR